MRLFERCDGEGEDETKAKRNKNNEHATKYQKDKWEEAEKNRVSAGTSLIIELSALGETTMVYKRRPKISKVNSSQRTSKSQSQLFVQLQ